MLLTHPTTAMATASDTTMNSTNKLLLLPTLSLSLCLSHSPLLPFLLNVPTTTTITTTLGNWAVSGQGLGTHGYARMCFSSNSGKSVRWRLRLFVQREIVVGVRRLLPRVVVVSTLSSSLSLSRTLRLRQCKPD